MAPVVFDDDQLSTEGLPTLLPGQAAPISKIEDVAQIVADTRTVVHLVGLLIDRSGMPAAEIARRMGISPQALNQYRKARRVRPSVVWLARLAQVCGATLELRWRQHGPR